MGGEEYPIGPDFSSADFPFLVPSENSPKHDMPEICVLCMNSRGQNRSNKCDRVLETWTLTVILEKKFLKNIESSKKNIEFLIYFLHKNSSFLAVFRPFLAFTDVKIISASCWPRSKNMNNKLWSHIIVLSEDLKSKCSIPEFLRRFKNKCKNAK